MNNLVQDLEQCWYISPPWGPRIPPLLVSLLERVYVKRVKAFGYCCGVEWSPQGWKYEISTGNDNISVWGSELIGTGNLQPVTKENLCLAWVSWSSFDFIRTILQRALNPPNLTNNFGL
ncbi:DUF1392 family protein [Nostoc flagelliforme FACHB-838]|uniref:DUF1392 family protein n=1 Tax=Nostoc flagelliforme FACHB-838 TaxID=2692904 RepID=A0ABR8E6Q6_9NOSO|nr:DUF1392 family protein [Nostoc flagelliforme]MBD2537078.1 DUF1392 family protein [Nostoc flagelliforme FACHB-838]